jgi:hypothetical protein
MHFLKLPLNVRPSPVMPNNLIPKVFLFENQIANDFQVMRHRRVAMKEKAAGIFEQFMHIKNAVRHCRQISRSATVKVIQN